jgi:2-C-methyl-D-erythritol 4-phosphate cytidylyltransferase
MKIEITIDETLLRDVAENEIRRAFLPSTATSNGGTAATEVRRQVEGWAKRQDFYVLIEEAARPMLPEIVAPTIRAALESAVKKELRRLKESGKLEEMVQASLLEQAE